MSTFMQIILYIISKVQRIVTLNDMIVPLAELV